MSADDQEMLARIRNLEGLINQRRSQQSSSRHAHVAPSTSQHHPGYTSSWRRGRGAYPYHRGRHHAQVPVYRNRTLVLNGSSQGRAAEASDSGANSDSSTSSWVTKNSRHLQLINSSVYEKEPQSRATTLRQTLQQKRLAQDERERAKLLNHFNHMANADVAAPPGQSGRASANRYEINIQGIPFVVAKSGSKLVRVPGSNPALPTPKMAVVAGVRFCRSKNGNLYRQGIVKAQRQMGVVKKVDTPCKIFSLTGNSIFHDRGPKPCRHDRDSVSPEVPTNFYLGSCLKGPHCRYIHDPNKVAVCKEFLQQGVCVNGDACDLSHDLTPERILPCLHFARDSCTNPNCRYAHVKVSPGAPVCRAFGLYGYCEKGADCPDRHAFECPDFSNTGVCRTKRCKLPHRERASALRKANNTSDGTGDDDVDMEDVSSDDDGSVDDVDSDEVDEFLGPDDRDHLDMGERDYIAL